MKKQASLQNVAGSVSKLTRCKIQCLVPTLLLVLPWAVCGQAHRLDNAAIGTNGFGFRISWTNGATVAVEMTTNLTNSAWVRVATNTLSGGTGYFNDSSWTNNTYRFYRSASVAERNYSTNIVGFAKVHIDPGYNLLANPLSAGVTNGANEVLAPMDGQSVLTWAGTEFRTACYDVAFGGWTDANFNPAPPPSLPPGKGFFLYHPYPATNLTFVGDVVPAPCTTNCVVLSPGYNLVGSALPLELPFDAPAFSFPKVDAMGFLTWTGYGYVVHIYDFAFGGWVGEDFLPWGPPVNKVGTGFFLFISEQATNWCQSLSCP